MTSAKKLLEAAAGTAAAGGAGLDVAEVFSTFLYKGNSGTQTITNGIDLTEGGLVWSKNRGSGSHSLMDTARGGTKLLKSDTTGAEASYSGFITSFNSNGFALGDSSQTNYNNTPYASWTFRKAKKFFDIVTYSGNGASGRLIDHNLGSAPGMVVIKSSSTAGTYWSTYHRGLSSNNYILLNTAGAQAANGFTRTVNSTQYELGPNWADENQNYRTYVAYLFAHNDGDGDFGPDGDQDIISCGSYTGNGSATGPVVNLGWEPQWVMLKNTDGTGNWVIFDKMRGIPTGSNDNVLYANKNFAENTSNDYLDLNATGFQIKLSGSDVNSNGETYIYMAIRAPMIKEPEAATDVFAINTFGSQGGSVLPTWLSGFPVDMAYYKSITTDGNYIMSRLTQGKFMQTNTTNPEGGLSAAQFDYNNGYYTSSGVDTNYYSWMWKRAKGYFDVVTYTGTGSARTVAHSLGVAPEMMWVKNREDGPSYSSSWGVYHGDNTNYVFLNDGQVSNDDVSYWNDTSPTSSVFTVGTQSITNKNNTIFIAYLFATLDGISKCGSFTGTGSLNNIDCGFSNGAKYVIIKKTSAAGEWFVFDTSRGISTASTDGVLQLQSTSQQYTEQAFSNQDMIRPYSSGFAMATGGANQANENSQTYMFYAVAT